MGEFSDESNALGITLNVIIGFNLIGYILGVVDFLKHSDELAPVFRNLDELADGLGDATRGIMKNGDEIFSAIKNTVFGFNSKVADEVMPYITKVYDDLLDGLSDGARKVVDDLGDGIKSILDIPLLKEGDKVSKSYSFVQA